MITLSNNTKGLALLHQVGKIHGKVYTSDSLLETVLYWGINCNSINYIYTQKYITYLAKLISGLTKFMGRNCYGPKLSWAEIDMGRNDPEPSNHVAKE